jgi:hypothetical protein
VRILHYVGGGTGYDVASVPDVSVAPVADVSVDEVPDVSVQVVSVAVIAVSVTVVGSPVSLETLSLLHPKKPAQSNSSRHAVRFMKRSS